MKKPSHSLSILYKKIYIEKDELSSSLLMAGLTALSKRSMMNPPLPVCYAGIAKEFFELKPHEPILSVMNAVSFLIAIMLTDFIFHTHMGAIMLKLFQGNIYIYALILFAEGSIIGISQLFISRAVYARLFKQNKNIVIK